jgi:hypothetical protein
MPIDYRDRDEDFCYKIVHEEKSPTIHYKLLRVLIPSVISQSAGSHRVSDHWTVICHHLDSHFV